MPDALSVASTVATSPEWISRVHLTVTDAAVDILAEDANTPDHEARVRLARYIIRGDQAILAPWPRLVMTNESVRAAVVADAENNGLNVPDNDLLFTVSSLWTNVAKSLL